MMVAETTKPHVALLPSPGLGHIIPLFELAKRLVIHHDFHVSFLVITTNEASAAQEQLLRSPTLPSGLDIVELPPVDVCHYHDDTLVLTRICVIVEESLKSLKSVLIELGNPKALVIDLFCTQAFEVCGELSIPVYSFCTASTALLTLSLYLPTLDREVDEQRINATILAEEVGVAIKPAVGEGKTTVGRKEIERVVKLVIEGEEGKLMRTRALKLQESAAKALDICGSSHDSLARVAKEWKA
ncbi:hypothetical protein GH714_005901 [Hevea brasiliensis]|uniref:Uncharacterized protein n=1 Tax=Hevea brasiliensis TaxID=3981 RepID=A0A6A6LEQ4_HEVBR|nr:hypothetical protein GH714_005901 [Hevea brasiliensis]